MECPEVQNRLSAYFDGELEEDQRLVIAAHLERCSACAEELQVFGRLSE